MSRGTSSATKLRANGLSKKFTNLQGSCTRARAKMSDGIGRWQPYARPQMGLQARRREKLQRTKKRKTRDFTSSVRATRTPTQVRSCLEFDLVLRAVVQWSPGRIRRDVTGIIPLGSVAASHSKACSQTWPLFLHRRPITTSGSRCPFLRRPGFLRGPWRTGRGTASGGLPRRIGTPAARTMPTSSSRPGHPPQQKGAV